MDLKLGEKYKIGKKLGAGAFGEVYIAKDTATGEDVAVKVEDNRTRHHSWFAIPTTRKSESARAN